LTPGDKSKAKDQPVQMEPEPEMIAGNP